MHSYTRFSYAASAPAAAGEVDMPSTIDSREQPAAHPAQACGAVQNTGKVAAQEVVQLYASRRPASAEGYSGLEHVPRVQLVSFARVGPIAPQQTLRVCLPVDTDALRLLGPGGSFGVQPGVYDFSFGPKPPGPAGLYVEPEALSEGLTRAGVHVV